MPIKILLIEDQPRRATELRSLLEQRLLNERVDLEVAENVHDGAEFLRARYFDLLLLDICLPMRQGEDPVQDGGLRLLRSLKAHSELRLPGYIVGLTEYDDLAERYASEFNESMWLIVKYEQSSEAWFDRLAGHVNHILTSRGLPSALFDYDLAILTALPAVELKSVLDLDCSWETKRFVGDDAIYHAGKIATERGTLRVGATACLEMGMPAAAISAMKLIDNFRPRYIAMTGIAAGVVGDFGDILIADQSWDYGSGKLGKDNSGLRKFLPAPTAIQLNPALKYQLNWFVSRRSALEKIRSAWRGREAAKALKVHIGPLASGASVVESKELIEELLSHNRKLIGVEMETYGVFLAARMCREPRPTAMSFKSVCDFGNGEKDDQFQEYAAFTSANFLYEFAIDSLVAKD